MCVRVRLIAAHVARLPPFHRLPLPLYPLDLLLLLASLHHNLTIRVISDGTEAYHDESCSPHRHGGQRCGVRAAGRSQVRVSESGALLTRGDGMRVTTGGRDEVRGVGEEKGHVSSGASYRRSFHWLADWLGDE